MVEGIFMGLVLPWAARGADLVDARGMRRDGAVRAIRACL